MKYESLNMVIKEDLEELDDLQERVQGLTEVLEKHKKKIREIHNDIIENLLFQKKYDFFILDIEKLKKEIGI